MPARHKVRTRYAVRGAASLLVLVAATSLVRFECPEDPLQLLLDDDRPTYMLYGDHVNSGYLTHVQQVLRRLGFKQVTNSTTFHLLWSHPYAFGEKAPFAKSFLANLLPNQKVNHLPGTGFYTNKVNLATSGLKHIPPAFQLPAQKNDIINYSKKYPDKLFVQKNNFHRDIKVLQVGEMNLDSEDTFVQEFVQNPLLVDGHKFDIGIYTVLTSVDPLRVYIYKADVLLRFCPKKYEPFDAKDVYKYVVADDYIPIWEMPSLNSSFVKLRYSMKDSLSALLQSRGQDPQKIWDEIEESIREVFLNKEDSIVRVSQQYSNQNNFFEMVRFDFIVNADLHVYLMEANMSPNLSSAHFPQNRLLYESVLFHLFSLTGIARRVKGPHLSPRSKDEEEMEVAEKQLTVFAEDCLNEGCRSCLTSRCQLCRSCWTQRSLHTLRASYHEHLNRGEFSRILPPRFKPGEPLASPSMEKYSPENRFLTEWFLGKCIQDSSWC